MKKITKPKGIKKFKNVNETLLMELCQTGASIDEIENVLKSNPHHINQTNNLGNTVLMLTVMTSNKNCMIKN